MARTAPWSARASARCWRATGPASFAVTTTQGNFSFSSQDVPFGTSKTFLNGKALVAQTGAQYQLTSSLEEEDFPSMAQSGDDVYLGQKFAFVDFFSVQYFNAGAVGIVQVHHGAPGRPRSIWPTLRRGA